MVKIQVADVCIHSVQFDKVTFVKDIIIHLIRLNIFFSMRV